MRDYSVAMLGRLMSSNPKSTIQLIRYGVVGLTSNGLAYLVFLVLTYLGLEPKFAMTLVYIVCATLGYVGHKKWTFTHIGSVLSSSARYVIAHCCGYLVNLIILYAFYNKLGFSYQLVQVVAIFVVAACLFLMFKFFVFTHSTNAESENY